MKLLNRLTICLIANLFYISMPVATSWAQSKKKLEQLRQQVNQELAKQPGVFAVAFKDLGTGQELLIREREEFHAASTMKTPVMIEIYKQAAQKRLSLDDSITIKTEFKSIVDGSPYTLDAKTDSDTSIYKYVGTKRTIDSLVYDMIIWSSNLATNLVIELADAQKVTQTMREMGANDIQVRRGVEDSKAFAQGLNNTTTAYDLMVIFEKIALGQAVSPAASEAMIKTLLDQRFKTKIPAKLPKDVKVAHKTGSIKGVLHDSGIVFLPDGRKYVLVLLSKDIQNEQAIENVMATVSKLIYDYVKG
jgi:beta-lactamase class A